MKDTGIPGVKQRIKDNKYLVTLDLGRQLRMNKKTGKLFLTPMDLKDIMGIGDSNENQ